MGRLKAVSNPLLREGVAPRKLPQRQRQTARRTQPPPRKSKVQSPNTITRKAKLSDQDQASRRKFTLSSDESDFTKIASDPESNDVGAGDGEDSVKQMADSGAKTSRDLVASALWNRYHEHGRLGDLEEAIRLDRQSLKVQAAIHDQQEEPGVQDPLTVVNLGVSLYDLFNHTRAPEALDESVQLLEHGLVLMSRRQPIEHPLSASFDSNVPEPEVSTEHASLPRAKVNLGNAYRARAELHGNPSDLDRAIELYESVLLHTPAEHSTWDLETRQNCLARSLMARGSQRDVERAMDLLSFRRAFREKGGGGERDGTERAMKEHEKSMNARFRERYLGVFDADVGIPIPDLTGFISKLTDFPSGCGGYADIFMGEWHRTRRFKQKVAIKVLRRHAPANNTDLSSQISDRVQKMIKAEVRIWHKLDHQNVVKLLGTCRGFGPFPSMICPWYANGSLPNFLQKHKSLIYSERLRMVREVASGLYFLHSNAIIHGDLTGANILIDENHSACLADFGLSTLARDFDLPSMSSSSSGIGGSVRWTAPELYAFGDSDKPPCATMYSDVYSFGCVALEIFSGDMPYHYVQHEMEVLLKYVIPGKRPDRPRGYKAVKDRHWAAVEHCWCTDPRARPMSKVLGDLFEDFP